MPMPMVSPLIFGSMAIIACFRKVVRQLETVVRNYEAHKMMRPERKQRQNVGDCDADRTLEGSRREKRPAGQKIEPAGKMPGLAGCSRALRNLK